MSEVIAVSASGGASKGAHSAGVIGHLCGTLGVDPVIWTGTSVGALNSLAACHVPLGDPVGLSRFVFDQWHRLQGNGSVYNWNPQLVKAVLEILSGNPDPNTRHSIMTTAPLWDYMSGIFDRDAVISSGRKMSAVAVSLKTGYTLEFRETDPDLLKGVFASAAMPVIFPAVYVRGQWCVDGGIRDVRPIAQAIALGATKIYDISTDPEEMATDGRSAWDLLGLALRTLGILVDEIVRTDRGAVCEKAGVEVVTIRPEKDLGDPLDFSRAHVHEMIVQGEKDAIRVLG